MKKTMTKWVVQVAAPVWLAAPGWLGAQVEPVPAVKPDPVAQVAPMPVVKPGPMPVPKVKAWPAVPHLDWVGPKLAAPHFEFAFDQDMKIDIQLPRVDFDFALPLMAQVDKEELKQRIKEDARRAAEDARRGAEESRRAVMIYRGGRDGYQDGTRALDRREYEEAVQAFERVIQAKSPRAEGAYYWKAYALNKLGKREEALAVLSELGKQYPQSRWLNDAKALTVEVQQAAGRGVSPEAQSDEDLKLFAINALVNSDPERAVPLLEKLLGEAKTSPRLKEKALFVLAQSRSDQARGIVGQYAKNGSNPDLQLHAVEYLGQFRTKESQQVLAEIYGSVNDVAVKRAVLRGYQQGRDTEHLLAVARSETNQDLRREAIDGLGSTQAANELAQLYAAETSFEWKERILRAMGRSHSAAKMLEVAKSDKDSRLRLAAVRQMGGMRKEITPDELVAMYGSESETSVRAALMDALFQQNAVKQVVEVARKESDPDLKRRAVQRLASSKSKEANDFLVELLNK